MRKISEQIMGRAADASAWFLRIITLTRVLGGILVFALLHDPVQAAQSVALAWDSSPDSTVVGYNIYYGGASSTYTNMVDVGNTTNVTIPGFIEGTAYYFAATAYDASDIESVFSNEVGYTAPLSNNLPTITFTAPLDGANYPAPATIDLAASVTANGHPISTVQFYNGATLLGEDTTAPYNWTWNNVSAGSYSLSARLVYNGSSALASAPANIAVTNSLPIVALTSPAAGDTFTAPAAINLAASVTANGHTISTVQFYNGATLLGEDTAAPYSFAWNNISAGSYALTARAVYASAVPITGSIAFNSVPVFDNIANLALATKFTDIKWEYVAPRQQFGDYAAIPNFASVAFKPFTFVPPDASVLPLWTLTIGLTTYSFDATSVTASYNASLQIWNIGGTGTAKITGMDDTFGTWNLSANKQASSFFFGSATSNIVTSASVNVTVTNPPPVIALTSPIAGASYASPATIVSVTNTLPILALTAPLDGANYPAPATIDLTASVSANGHPISTVQFYNGATLLGEDSSAPYNWTWRDVSAGSYSLSAWVVYDAGSKVTSSPVNIDVTGLPAPWQTADIGVVGVVGSASMSNGIYTVKGAGNISGTADNFRFVYQALSGDGEIEVRLNSVENTGTSGRIGMMIRESLTSSSKYAFIGISSDGRFRWQRRSNTGAATSSTTSTIGTPPNVWMRLVRTGNMLYGYRSTNGTTWTQVGSRSIAMATSIQVGLVVASGSAGTLNTATFDSVALVP